MCKVRWATANARINGVRVMAGVRLRAGIRVRAGVRVRVRAGIRVRAGVRVMTGVRVRAGIGVRAVLCQNRCQSRASHQRYGLGQGRVTDKVE